MYRSWPFPNYDSWYPSPPMQSAPFGNHFYMQPNGAWSVPPNQGANAPVAGAQSNKGGQKKSDGDGKGADAGEAGEPGDGSGKKGGAGGGGAGSGQ